MTMLCISLPIPSLLNKINWTRIVYFVLLSKVGDLSIMQIVFCDVIQRNIC